MPEIFAHLSRRQAIIVLAIWAFLLLGAVMSVAILNTSAGRVMHEIEYVKAGRYPRAMVLYTDGEQNAKKVLEQADMLNRGKHVRVLVNSDWLPARRALESFQRANRLDPRPTFDPERRVSYDFQAQVYEAVGDRRNQLAAHIAAFLCARDYSDADQYISLARELEGDSSEVSLLAARRYELSGDTSSSLQIMNRLYATSGTISVEARRVMANLMLRDEQTTKAIQEMEKGIQADPDYLDLRKELALALVNTGQLDEAIRVYKNGLNSGGDKDANYLHMFGNTLYKRGMVKESIPILEQAVDLEPTSGDVEFSLARSYNKIGDRAQASRHLARATELDPNLLNKAF